MTGKTVAAIVAVWLVFSTGAVFLVRPWDSDSGPTADQQATRLCRLHDGVRSVDGYSEVVVCRNGAAIYLWKGA